MSILFKLIVFVIIVQKVMQAKNAKWGTLLLKPITCLISNIKTTHVKIYTILIGEITQTSHGITIKG